MLSMNGIIVCELILGGVLMSLVFTSLGNTDLIAGPLSKSKDAQQPDGSRTATKPDPAQIEFSPDAQKSFSNR